MNKTDAETDVLPVSKVCIMCKHFFLSGLDQQCKAFPCGIPMDIWMGKNPHTERHPDQTNDVVFEAIERTKLV